MKRAVAILIAGVFLLESISAFAQTQSAPGQGYPKEAYVKNISLIKIMVHPLGYKLLYRKGVQIGELYVPLTWFSGGVISKAYISYGSTPDRPYVSIAWVDGKFDNITINAQEMGSPTWGILNSTTDLTAQFNIQEPPRDF